MYVQVLTGCKLKWRSIKLGSRNNSFGLIREHTSLKHATPQFGLRLLVHAVGVCSEDLDSRTLCGSGCSAHVQITYIFYRRYKWIQVVMEGGGKYNLKANVYLSVRVNWIEPYGLGWRWSSGWSTGIGRHKEECIYKSRAFKLKDFLRRQEELFLPSMDVFCVDSEAVLKRLYFRSTDWPRFSFKP